jgi:hypothetical protein
MSPEDATVGPTFEIEERTRLIFESWFPPSWLKRRLSPDFHLDYRIEVVEHGEPTGANFLVQLKGRTIPVSKAQGCQPNWRLSLRTKHLRYFLQCKEPVFIFLIDPAQNSGRLGICAFLSEKHSFE